MWVTVPLYLTLSKSSQAKRYHINLNQYRNWHFQSSNAIKTKYTEMLQNQLDGVKFKKPIKLTLVMIRGDKRKIDRSNVLCIHEKFFCDALVHYKCIPDDNDSFIKETTYKTGTPEKGNGRIEILITEV